MEGKMKWIILWSFVCATFIVACDTLDKKLNGVVKEYYESGALKFERNFKDGKLNGVWKYYDLSGYLSTERNYKDDKLNGVVKEYYEWGF